MPGPPAPDDRPVTLGPSRGCPRRSGQSGLKVEGHIHDDDVAGSGWSSSPPQHIELLMEHRECSGNVSGACLSGVLVSRSR